jgi:D-erythronate 2-dehydrogenase
VRAGSAAPHVVITGAGGFIGRLLVDRLVSDERFAAARFTLLGRAITDPPTDPRVCVINGDISDLAVRREVIGARSDLVFHLAAVLSAAAQANYPLSRRVNVDATLSLFEELCDAAAPPRVVFASSISVFGTGLPPHVNDDTIPRPATVYGAQKLMMEIALQHFSDRGLLDGLALRLPGIVASPKADARMKAAAFNTLFCAYARGADFTFPIGPEGTTWLLSVRACVEALVHAGTLRKSDIGERRAFTLPAQRVRMADLVAALARRFPETRAAIHYCADPALQALLASHPPLTTGIADSLGFQHDGDLDRLVSSAVLGLEPRLGQ